jgi:putative aldouronate transport system permease protein
MPGRRFFALLLVVPMYITGGMIANYVNIYQLGLFNNFFVYILPAGFVTFYMLIMRTYFNTIPPSLDESARLDGASELKIFVFIILPLSMPIISTVALFAGVGQWNSWFDAMVYTSSRSLRPLQMVLQSILLANDTQAMMRQAAQQARTKTAVSPETIQMATLIVATVPIMLVYPFLQKYFVKGMMIGAVKS